MKYEILEFSSFRIFVVILVVSNFLFYFVDRGGIVVENLERGI